MNIKELIVAKSESMSAVQKHLAMAILDAPEEAAFMTAAQLGKYAKVSEASVIRFARTLGFEKYSDLRASLSRVLRDRLSTAERAKDTEKLSREGFYASMLQRDIDAMSSAKEELKDENIDALGEVIAKAPAVYVCSCRSSYALGYYLAFYLTWILPRVRALSHENALEVLGTAPQGSVVVGISFPRYTKWTVDILRHAHALGLTVATLTSEIGSPLSAFSKCMLAMPYRLVSFIDSFSVPMAVINCLLLSVFRFSGQEAQKRLECLEKVWKTERVYVD